MRGYYPETGTSRYYRAHACVYQIVQFKLCDHHIRNLVHITFTLFDMHTFDGEGGGRSKNSFFRIGWYLFFSSNPYVWAPLYFLFWCGPYPLLITPILDVWILRVKAPLLIAQFTDVNALDTFYLPSPPHTHTHTHTHTKNSSSSSYRHHSNLKFQFSSA